MGGLQANAVISLYGVIDRQVFVPHVYVLYSNHTSENNHSCELRQFLPENKTYVDYPKHLPLSAIIRISSSSFPWGPNKTLGNLMETQWICKNPAPVDIANIPLLFTGFYASQVVQHFFHQQEDSPTKLTMSDERGWGVLMATWW